MSRGDVSIKDVFEAIQEFRKETRDTYVSKDEFLPVKLIVYGFMSVVGLTVLGALITTVVKAY